MSLLLSGYKIFTSLTRFTLWGGDFTYLLVPTQYNVPFLITGYANHDVPHFSTYWVSLVGYYLLLYK